MYVLSRSRHLQAERQREADEGDAAARCFSDHPVDLAVIDRADPLFLKQIASRSVLIAPDLAELRVIVSRGLEAFLANRVEQVLVERYLERIIGRMIDVNYHLLTESGEPPPRDDYQSFVELGGRFLPPDFARRMASAAGLRNRIAHEYDDIDPQRLFEGMEAAARDIPHWIRHVADALASRE